MKKLFILATLALGVASLSAPASARNYDCSKAGNVNKAACKSPVAASVATHKTTKVTTVKTTSRNYDCTKVGNKNKAACRTTTVQATTVPKVVKTTTVARTYDCTKFYNKMRAVCRTQVTSTTTAGPTMAPTRAPMSRPTATRSTTVTRSVNSDSAGATAQCKDGSFSHAQHSSGACSHHGGVAKRL